MMKNKSNWLCYSESSFFVMSLTIMMPALHAGEESKRPIVQFRSPYTPAAQKQGNGCAIFDCSSCLECAVVTTSVSCKLCLCSASVWDHEALMQQPIVGRVFAWWMNYTVEDVEGRSRSLRPLARPQFSFKAK